MSLPSGTVTFLFTDIEGSTERWETFPEAMRRALKRHDVLLAAAVGSQGGHVFKTVGDAFCAAFRTASEGMAAALAAQRALAAEDWSAFGEGFAPIRVRMGLHTGAAEERDGDYFGRPLNRCARLQAAAHGGQVLVSLATQQLLRDQLAEGLELRDLGEHRLKDLTHSEHIFQLVAPDLPEVSTPPATSAALHVGDRIRIDAGARARSLPESLAALRAVVLDDAADARLSPDQIQEVLAQRPEDLTAYRLGRVAEWSQPRYRVDGRFVALELLVDQGEQSSSGRWQGQEGRFEDLGALLGETRDPALVLLGPPGAGKSTLLRRYELDTAIRALVEEAGNEAGLGAASDASAAPVTFFVQLHHYRPALRDEAPTLPQDWLEARWAARYPDLPALSELLKAGRMVLLLDGLNEMPVSSEQAQREALGLWKDWLLRLTGDAPGNRVVFSCRSLDYSQPLSTPSLRVPQVRIEPMGDEGVLSFLQVYSPLHWREIWTRLEGSAQLEVLRSPYFLRLLTEQVEADGAMPEGRAGLFTGFVRQTLRREVEQANPLFEPERLVSKRDIRRITHWRWKSDYELPDRGLLLPKLAALAYGMQSRQRGAEPAQVRVDYDEALDLIDDERDEEIIRAGVAISVLDEDPAADEVMYVHQLVQEYFAGREMARALELDPALMRVEWRAERFQPALSEILDALDPADPLPGPPQTGWEETTLLAAAMAAEPASLIAEVAEANLVLAARCAALPELRLPPALLDDLRGRLIARCDEPAADLRHRLACAFALGDLGDPRFEQGRGPRGEYRLPPLVDIPGGSYPIGDDARIRWSDDLAGQDSTDAHCPRHAVEVQPFHIGRFPVTNAEWACFMAAEGYEDERFWDTPDARAWRRGELPDTGAMENKRIWRGRLVADPALFERMVEDGRFISEESERTMKRWMTLDDETFERELAEAFQGSRLREPLAWRKEAFNHPAQPVIGISWYEARAYCAWLSEQSGRSVRLPSEVEWEAAARGFEGRPFPFGDDFDRLAANTVETKLRCTSPIGAFPDGRTPEGVDDLCGNVFEWTSSAFGRAVGDAGEIEFPYPYDPRDGREDPALPPGIRRVLRGGGWADHRPDALAFNRDRNLPDSRYLSNGFRIVVAAAGPR